MQSRHLLPRHVIFGLLIITVSLTAHNQVFGASESVAYNFGSFATDGTLPQSALLRDANGNLYGTTTFGGSFVSPESFGGGTAFKLSPSASGGAPWTELIVWNFSGNGNDGGEPLGALIMDGSGNLYGTANDAGANFQGMVFELTPPSSTCTPPAGQNWCESQLWNFGPSSTDGDFPEGLVMDKTGNLYGTTVGGGTEGAGTAYELSPSAGGGAPWNETILWNFDLTATDDFNPESSLVMDSSGNLYGTGSRGGTNNFGGAVFKLSPPSSTCAPPAGQNWCETILWNFGTGTDGEEPLANVIMDKSGNLYGTTVTGGIYSDPIEAAGTAFELSPPSSACNPPAGQSWCENILWYFGNGADGAEPFGGLTMDNSGNLYGTTAFGGVNAFYGFGGNDRGGTAFELAPPAGGTGLWSESVLWSFGSGADGNQPQAGLVTDNNGNFFGTTYEGGANSGAFGFLTDGTVFEVSTGAPQILRRPRIVQFPNTAIGSSSTAILQIENSGTANLIGSVNPPPAPFGLSGSGSFNLPPNGRVMIKLTFTPTASTTLLKGDNIASNSVVLSTLPFGLQGTGMP